MHGEEWAGTDFEDACLVPQSLSGLAQECLVVDDIDLVADSGRHVLRPAGCNA